MSDQPTPNDAPEPESAALPEEQAAADGEGELALVRRERDEFLDQLQRSRAEFANYQKRARAQAETDRQYAASALAIDLLPVIDNLDRAIDAARKAGAGAILEGVELVRRQLLEVLAKHGVEPIEALGLPFDPNRHEAVVQQPSPGHPEGTVIAELGRGYRHRDRVLRPSKVAVSTTPAS
jgi:molecular chaperone GrpE